MPRPVRISSGLRAAIEKYIPTDEWVDLAETIPGVVFGIDLAKEGGDVLSAAYFTSSGVHVSEIGSWPGKEKPPMRNVTPAKPKLLKESNES